jgi:hypothetical protein
VVVLDVTIHCPTVTAYPPINVDTSAMTGSVAWSRVRMPSQAVRGTYTVGFNGTWTAPLNWNDGAGVLQQRLLATGLIKAVSVSNYNDPNDGISFFIDIAEPLVSNVVNSFFNAEPSPHVLMPG